MEIGKGFEDLPVTGSMHMLITSLELIQDISVLLWCASAFLTSDLQLGGKKCQSLEQTFNVTWASIMEIYQCVRIAICLD